MAIITVSNSGGTRNWTDPLTWVGGSVPLATDSVIFTNTSGNLIINTISTIVDFNLSNFTGTITFTGALIINGNWHLGGGIYTYTQLGTSYVRKQGTGTITSNGVIWSREFRFVGNGTTTLVDDLNLTGPLQFQGSGGPANMVVNGNNIFHTGTYTASVNGGIISGTTKYWYQGTGTVLSQSISSFSINIDFYINTVGAFVISGVSTNGIVFGGNKELKVISGTLITSSLSALTLNGRTIDFNGNIINNLRLINTTQTVTLLSPTIVDTLTLHHTTTIVQTINGFNIDTGNLSITGTGTTSRTQGSTYINFVGTGTWSHVGSGSLRNNVIINTPGTVTISGTVRYSTGTLNYAAGTVDTTGSTFICSGAATINSNGDPTGTSTTSSTGINFNNFNTPGGLVTNATPIRIIGTWTHLYNCTSNVYVNGSLVVTSNSVGTGTSITLNGTGSWSGTPALRNVNLIIDTLGTINITTNVSVSGAAITYVQGTVNTAGSTLTITTSTTLNVNGSPTSTSTTSSTGINFNNLTVIGGTLTLSSNLTVIGNFITSNPITYTGSNLILNGNLTINQATSGTTVFIYKGTGIWSGGGTINNLFQINTTLGTLTCSGTISASNLSRIAGTVNTSGSTLLSSNSSNTWDTAGIIWNNVTVGAGTVNLPSSLTVGGILTVGASNNVTFTGASGFSVANLSCTTAGRIITLASGITYDITNNLNIVGTVGSKITLRTLTTPRAIFTLPYGATQNVQNTNATNIDSSLGQTIYSSAGTLTSTINWSIGSGSNSGNFFIVF